jgi:CheY-like chemotaxis protein
MQTSPNTRDRTQTLLRFLQQVGRLSSRDAARLAQSASANDQPVEHLLEQEGLITQRNLAILLGDALQLPLVHRFRQSISRPQSQLSETAARVAIEMLIDDGLARLAEGATPQIPRGANEQTVQPSAEPAPQPTSQPKPATTGRGSLATPTAARSFRALVVDDDPDLRRIVRATIERSGLGLTVITAQDADEALTLTELERPDVVILDLSMPGLDGYDMCQRLRRARHTKRVPVLILSANGTPESVDRARRAGASDYVVKPFKREDFIARVRRLIDGAFGATATAGHTQEPPY